MERPRQHAPRVARASPRTGIWKSPKFSSSVRRKKGTGIKLFGARAILAFWSFASVRRRLRLARAGLPQRMRTLLVLLQALPLVGLARCRIRCTRLASPLTRSFRHRRLPLSSRRPCLRLLVGHFDIFGGALRLFVLSHHPRTAPFRCLSPPLRPVFLARLSPSPLSCGRLVPPFPSFFSFPKWFALAGLEIQRDRTPAGNHSSSLPCSPSRPNALAAPSAASRTGQHAGTSQPFFLLHFGSRFAASSSPPFRLALRTPLFSLPSPLAFRCPSMHRSPDACVVPPHTRLLCCFVPMPHARLLCVFFRRSWHLQITRYTSPGRPRGLLSTPTLLAFASPWHPYLCTSLCHLSWSPSS